jgi:hypothetical protein
MAWDQFNASLATFLELLHDTKERHSRVAAMRYPSAILTNGCPSYPACQPCDDPFPIRSRKNLDVWFYFTPCKTRNIVASSGVRSITLLDSQ